jgi:four helix bundle protein
MTIIVPKLPSSEQYDLKDQLSRSSKAIPRLIAEGYAKRHQKRGFQKYLDDAMAECNETIVSLSQCNDIYSKYIDTTVCKRLLEAYDISGRQLYKLEKAWSRIKDKARPAT